MCSSSPPKAPPPPPPPPAAPQQEDIQMVEARERERRRVANASGRESTMLNGAIGVTGVAPTAMKTLLGA